jgi:hypothetical protein
VAGGDGFEIDTAGVRAFSANLQSEVDKTIAPASERIKQNLMWHAPFGERSGSPAVQAASVRYYGQMRGAVEFLDNLIHNASSLARAAEDAVAAYKAGDELSATTMAAIVGSAATRTQETERASVHTDAEAARADADSPAALHRNAGR